MIRVGLLELTFALTLLFPSALLAQRFSFSARAMSGNTASNRESAVLRGDARVVSDNITITAEEIELSGQEFRFVRARGDVVITDSSRGLRVEASEVFFDRRLKVSQIRGSAYLEDQKNEIVVRGGFLENRENEDIILIQIGVRIVKKDLIARSDMARYDRKNQTLELSGMPVVVYKGDEFRARRITIDIRTNEILLDGKVSGIYVPRSSPTEAPTEDPAASPASTPPSPEEERESKQ